MSSLLLLCYRKILLQITETPPSPSAEERVYPAQIRLRLRRELIVLYWALTFLLAAGVTWSYGFHAGSIAAEGLIRLVFLVFLILFIMTFGSHLTRSTN